MTFSLVARCDRTGDLAVGVATSDIAVGARVPWLRAGVGAAVSQHTSDPRLGLRVLDLLGSGCTAQEALDGTAASTPLARARQLAVVPATGPAAAYSGALVDPAHSAHLVADDAAVVGNILASREVGEAILSTFTQSDPDLALAERVVRALEAGLAAGGEQFPLRSAALAVVDDQPFRAIDLRVDWDEQPLARLRDLWQRYEPRRAEYRSRALDPDLSYGE